MFCESSSLRASHVIVVDYIADHDRMSSVCVAITMRRLGNQLEAEVAASHQQDRVFVHMTVRVTRQVSFVLITGHS